MSASVSGTSAGGTTPPPASPASPQSSAAASAAVSDFLNTGTGAGTATQQVAPPSSALSAYQYQTYISGANITVGAGLADLLGLPANSVTNGEDIMARFLAMSGQNLTALENWLHGAGYYTNAEYAANTSRPVLGGHTMDDFNAMSLAILDAANQKTSLSQVISSGVATNKGETQIAGQITPEQGGGNAYQINLPNPDDVRQSAFQEFQQALGRNPTQDELDAVTKALDAQTTAYQQSINQQQEAQSVAVYQAKLQGRQALLNPAVLPQVPTATPGAPTGAATPGQSRVGQRQAGAGEQNLPSSQPSTDPAVQKYLAAQAAAKQSGQPMPPALAAAAKNPKVAAWLQQNALASQYQVTSPADFYVAPTTSTNVQAPSAAAAAFTEATTGANAAEFGGQNYLNGFLAVQGLINNPVKA